MATSVTGGDDNINLLLPHLLSLDETYKHVLLAIDGEMRQYAQRLFRCPAVSIRPLGMSLHSKHFYETFRGTSSGGSTAPPA